MEKNRLDLRQSLDALIRLRRARRAAQDPETRDDISSALSCLEEIIGPSVSRASTARLLGISQTALDNWIRKGDIAVVLTPNGRREVPLPQLVDLFRAVKEEREEKGSRALASVVRDQRRQAEQLPIDELLPARVRRNASAHGHRRAELRSLAYHRAVARRLDEETVAEARRQLQKWIEKGEIHPHWAKEWERVLAAPVSKIAQLISSDSVRARERRQSSPFVGLLSEQERKRVLAAVKDAVA